MSLYPVLLLESTKLVLPKLIGLLWLQIIQLLSVDYMHVHYDEIFW